MDIDRDPYEPLPVKRPRYFVVRGSGTFPLDMLRYDRAWAVTGIGEDSDELRTVVCACKGKPTPERWGSFGWLVTRDKIKPPTVLLETRKPEPKKVTKVVPGKDGTFEAVSVQTDIDDPEKVNIFE